MLEDTYTLESPWIEEGRDSNAHEMTLLVLTKCFVELPEELVEKVKASNAGWCGKLIEQALSVKSLAELNWQEI